MADQLEPGRHLQNRHFNMPTPNESETNSEDVFKKFMGNAGNQVEPQTRNMWDSPTKEEIINHYNELLKKRYLEIKELEEERDALRAEVNSKNSFIAAQKRVVADLQNEVKQWRNMAEWFYEYVTHMAGCWTKDYMNEKAKDCTCRLNESIAEFEKLKEGK